MNLTTCTFNLSSYSKIISKENMQVHEILKYNHYPVSIQRYVYFTI